MCDAVEFVTTERVAVVVRLLTLGRRMTTREVAEIAGITPGGAWSMLGKLSRVLPLAEDGGVWAMLSDSDA